MLASYTFSKVIDTAPDATSVVSGNGGDDAKVAQDTLLPNLDRGPGVNDIAHRFVFSAVWDLNYAKLDVEPRGQSAFERLDAFLHRANTERARAQRNHQRRSGERYQHGERSRAAGWPRHAPGPGPDGRGSAR